MTKHSCTNCDNYFTGQFCNNCGQKESHRITMGHIGHELIHAFTHADKGFLHLLTQMFIRPGIVAREYIIEGKRKRYFTPFQYILVIGTIAAFIAVNSHFIETTVQAIGGSDQFTGKKGAFLRKVATFQSKYYNFIILLQLPFFSFATYLVYRKYKFNYAEHLTLQTFITAQTTIIAVVVMVVIYILGKPGVYLASLMAFVSTIFQIYANRQFFEDKRVIGILKALVANILGLIFFMVFMMIALTIYGFASHIF